ncbi:hypothetical protein [Rhizobium glycinendophyticum]|uniref:Uncharacterized protein n=1 Tax=Rhizobium glycinendophyticum TaxID=2589807 RepID=A0A504U0F3_9HYPH|nr:hypothetical protein [Rhizobium glycinendophyticum]TPP06967.1 hypothetical protein FJQ55_14960 [Rhizobium glycinendophyticum]
MATEGNRPSKIPVCQHHTRPLPRQSDGDAFFQIYTGGMRAAEAFDNQWHIEPVLDNGHPCLKGVMSPKSLQPFFVQHGFKFIAFHRIGWHRGSYFSSWSPFIPGETNHMQGPADLWSHVASNIAQARVEGDLAALGQPSSEQIAVLLGNRTEAERLASSISLSLRSMDINVEQIAEFYNEQLVNHMASGILDGRRSSSTLDQTLFAHVHSFFMHLGAARDYLAAFCALRIGKDAQKVDSFAKLTETLRQEHFDLDDLLQLFHARNYLRPKPTSSSKFEVSGWMKEVTDLRNEFMHQRPYGDRFVERMGFAEPVEINAGLYRYIRPIVLENTEDDVQEVVLRHYREMTGLCHAAAVASGKNISIPTLKDGVIVSVELEGGNGSNQQETSDP